MNLELAEFVQGALSHRLEPLVLREWQASMQRRCLLHRFPCRLWYDFIYHWRVEAQPSRTYMDCPNPEGWMLPVPTTHSPAQELLCGIQIYTTPVVLVAAQTYRAEPEGGRPYMRIHRL